MHYEILSRLALCLADEIMLVEILKFFRTHDAPVSEEETFDIYAFMIAADVSQERGGLPVALDEVMGIAEAEAKELLEARA